MRSDFVSDPCQCLTFDVADECEDLLLIAEVSDDQLEQVDPCLHSDAILFLCEAGDDRPLV